MRPAIALVPTVENGLNSPSDRGCGARLEPFSEPADDRKAPSVGAAGQGAATALRAEPIQFPIYGLRRASLGAVPGSDQSNAHLSAVRDARLPIIRDHCDAHDG
jgi:hypothetical protein